MISMAEQSRRADDKSAAARTAPFIVVVFGAGWSFGSGAPWYWGIVAMFVGALWQTARNMQKQITTNDENEEEEE